MNTDIVHDFDAIFTTMRYPAGESHVSLKNYVPEKAVILKAYCRNFEDICNVKTADNILKRHKAKNITWFIPYFPFARHDRRIYKGDGLELEVAMDILKGIDVVTLDPHSDVLGVLPHIPQSEVVYAAQDEFGILDNNPYIVIPDAGATKKALTWAGTNKNVIQAYKNRNTSTGALSGFTIHLEDFEDRPCLIVDDICDGGGTFLGLGDILKGRKAGPLTLLISHGLFTKGVKGIDELLERFDRIITVSKIDSVGEKLTSISYAKLYQRGIVT